MYFGPIIISIKAIMLNYNRNNAVRPVEKDNEIIKALSVNQPFASAISEAVKTIEIRPWSTEYRGDLLICSTKRKFKVDDEYLPSGKALCIVNLVDCRPFVESDAEQALVENPDEYKGMYSWVFGAVLVLKPFIISGKQKLFDVELNINNLEGVCLQHCNEE